MLYAVAHCTDAGRMRTRNEDAALVLQSDLIGSAAEPTWVAAAVADGMGGQAHGDVAASLAVRTLAADLVHRLASLPWQQPVGEGDLVAAINNAMQAAAHRVNEAVRNEYGPMGCTLVAALLRGTRLLVANVGDSRAYLVHSQLQQITTDHSLVADMVAQGQLTHAAARTHPRRHEIYRMIGFERSAEADFFALDLEPGDTVLLCSDGLYTMVPDEDIFRVMSDHRPIDERCRALVDLANERGGEDNVTVVAVQLLHPEDSAGGSVNGNGPGAEGGQA